MEALRPIGMAGSFVRFGLPALAMLVVFEVAIPALSNAGLRMPLPWFAAGGIVFASLLVAAALTLRAERRRWTWAALLERTRLHAMSRGDWAWALGGVAMIGAMIGVVIGVGALLTSAFGLPPLDPTPQGLRFPPLGSGERWMLLVWLPFWTLNIFGEELWWRGVILPRQALAFGERTWWVHGLGWLVFHAAFGPPMVLFVGPIVFVQTWICVHRRSTTVGIVIHALINGPGFVAVALGLI